MTYELSAGERGSFIVGGRLAGPLKLVFGFVLGAAGAVLIWYITRKDLDSSEYYGLAIAGLIAFALICPAIIWTGIRKECLKLTVDGDTREVALSWQGVFARWMETLKFDQLEYFDVRAEGGRIRVWTLVLRTTEGRHLDVAKFREPNDAEREKEEANRALQRIAPDLKGTERNWRS
jgi:hypothetical protein